MLINVKAAFGLFLQYRKEEKKIITTCFSTKIMLATTALATKTIIRS